MDQAGSFSCFCYFGAGQTEQPHRMLDPYRRWHPRRRRSRHGLRCWWFRRVWHEKWPGVRYQRNHRAKPRRVKPIIQDLTRKVKRGQYEEVQSLQDHAQSMHESPNRTWITPTVQKPCNHGSQNKKAMKSFDFTAFSGAPPGTRTLGPLIKSQLLYQLS